MKEATVRAAWGSARAPLWVAGTVSLLSAGVYCLTAARELSLGDSPELVSVASTLGLAHPPGYPLYTLLAWVATRLPGGGPFFRVSILSAVFGAASAGVISLLAWEASISASKRRGGTALQTGADAAVPPLIGAGVAGLTFALSPTVWSQSTVPQVYSLSALLVFGALLLAVRWRRRADGGTLAYGPRGERLLWTCGLVLGLSFANHLTAVLAVPSIAVALFAGGAGRRVARGALRAVIFVALALSLYLYLPLRSAQAPVIMWARVDSPSDLFSYLAGSQYVSRLFAEPLPGVLAKLASFFSGVAGEVTWPLLTLAGVGLAVLWINSRRLFAVLVAELALVVAHAVSYRIPDVENYYIPAYAVLAICAGVAMARLPGIAAGQGVWWRRVLTLGLASAAVLSLWTSASVSWPGRDLSHSAGARPYLERMLGEIPENGIVLAQNERTIYPLCFARYVEGIRRDVAILIVRERAPHLRRWYPDVEFPSERDVISFSGGDPSVPCDPPLTQALPVARYLPLIVSRNAESRPVLADIDIGKSVFPIRCQPRGLLVQIQVDSPEERGPGRAPPLETDARVLADLLSHIREVEHGLRGSGARHEDGRTREAYATTLADLGQLLLMRGETRDGIRALEEAKDLAPGAAHIRNNLGVAYRNAKRLEDAYRELAAAIDLAPGRSSTYHNLSKLHLAAGEESKAMAALAVASRLQPSNIRYRLELAALHEDRGELDAAERILRWVERRAGDDVAARLAYGDFLRRQERYTEAVAAYGRVLESSPYSPGVFTSLSHCYWEMEAIDAAIATMRRSVELQPHNPRMKYDLALMLWRSGRPHEALPHLEDAVRLLPTAWQPVALKADILTDLGRHAEARRLFERAQELGARGTQFRRSWSELERARGDTAAALDILEGEFQ